MLFLHCQLGEDRYAMEIAAVAEVLPLLQIRPLPRPRPGVAGVFSYRGTPVTVIDLCEVTHGRPADRRLNTRIVLIHWTDTDARSRLVGVIAEKVKAVVSHVERAGTPSPGEAATRRDPMTTDGGDFVHWLDIGRLIAATDLSFDQFAAL